MSLLASLSPHGLRYQRERKPCRTRISTGHIRYTIVKATQESQFSRKELLLASCAILTSIEVDRSRALALPCQGMKPYDMQKCLRERNEGQEDGEDVDSAKLKLKQYEQPGELVTLPSGIQYREILEGTGKEVALGTKVSLKYTVYKLSSGAYYKYSSGGTPVLLWALGYGTEGKNDVGESYTCILGDSKALPVAVTLGMAGMRSGGRRRILVPPSLGWANDESTGPPRDTFGAQRRLANNRDGPLLFEADVTRVRDVGETGFDFSEYERVRLRSPYSFPPPPVYGK